MAGNRSGDVEGAIDERAFEQEHAPLFLRSLASGGGGCVGRGRGSELLRRCARPGERTGRDSPSRVGESRKLNETETGNWSEAIKGVRKWRRRNGAGEEDTGFSRMSRGRSRPREILRGERRGRTRGGRKERERATRGRCRPRERGMQSCQGYTRVITTLQPPPR